MWSREKLNTRYQAEFFLLSLDVNFNININKKYISVIEQY